MDKTKRRRFTAIALVTVLMFVAVAGYALAFSSSEEDEILWHIRNTGHNFWRFWTEDSPGNFPHEVAAIKEVLNIIEAKLDGKPDIKQVTPVAVNIYSEMFEMRLWCSEAYLVKAVYAVVIDPDATIDIRWYDIWVDGDFAGEGSSRSWSIRHVDFDPSPSSSRIGHELLAQMNVDHPFGVGQAGMVRIMGDLQSTTDSSDDVLKVGAVVEIAQAATCTLTILP